MNTTLWPRVRINILRGFARFYLEVLIGSIIVVLLAGYWWYLRAGFDEIRNVGRYNLLSSSTYENYLNGYLEDLRQLDLRLKKLDQEKIAKFSDILPAEPDLPGLFVQLQAIAEASGLGVGSISFTEPAGATAPAAGQVASLDVSLAVSAGDYGLLKRYLTNLEENLRLLDVVSVNFGAEAEGPYAVQLRTYYLPR